MITLIETIEDNFEIEGEAEVKFISDYDCLKICNGKHTVIIPRGQLLSIEIGDEEDES